MQVIYNGFDFGLVELQDHVMESVYDDSGKDLLFQRIYLRFSGTLNAFATATGKGDVDVAGGGFGEEGDNLGFSIGRLDTILSEPRKNLRVLFGNQVVYEITRQDPEGGPIPERFHAHHNSGDKTATFVYSVRFVVTDCVRYVLSNRWSTTSDTDTEGMTVRTVRGTAIFRSDYLYRESLTPDDFRKWLIVPCPPGLRRWSVSCTAASDNTRLEYTVTDRQVGYGIGQFNAFNNGDGSWPTDRSNRIGITRIEGSITTGASLPVNMIRRIEAIALESGRTGFIAGSISGLRAGWDIISSTFGAALGYRVLPTLKASVKVYAQPGILSFNGSNYIASKQAMVDAALSIIYDRLRPAGVGGSDTERAPMTDFSVHQDIGSDNAPYIEVNATFMCLSRVALAALAFPVLSAGLQNFDTTFILQFSPTDSRYLSPLSSTPTLPYSNNTRGNFLTDMAMAALNATACTISVPAGPVVPSSIDGEAGAPGAIQIVEIKEPSGINGV